MTDEKLEKIQSLRMRIDDLEKVKNYIDNKGVSGTAIYMGFDLACLDSLISAAEHDKLIETIYEIINKELLKAKEQYKNV